MCLKYSDDDPLIIQENPPLMPMNRTLKIYELRIRMMIRMLIYGIIGVRIE